MFHQNKIDWIPTDILALVEPMLCRIWSPSVTEMSFFIKTRKMFQIWLLTLTKSQRKGLKIDSQSKTRRWQGVPLWASDWVWRSSVLSFWRAAIILWCMLSRYKHQSCLFFLSSDVTCKEKHGYYVQITCFLINWCYESALLRMVFTHRSTNLLGLRISIY